MSFSYQEREQGRAAIAALLSRIELLRRQAAHAGEERARTEIMDRRMDRAGRWLSDCGFRVGQSRETRELRELTERYVAEELRARAADIDFHRRKLLRTAGRFRFNDVRLPRYLEDATCT